MTTSNDETPTTSDYHSARSRTPSLEAQPLVSLTLESIQDEDGKQTVGVSSNINRDYKDKKIYVDPKSGLPIKPPSSFGLFMHVMRRGIKEGKVTFSEFHRNATQRWLKMSELEKEPFVERSKILTEQFKKIEALYLRKKVRQLENEVKEYRKSLAGVSRRGNNNGNVSSGRASGDIRRYRR